DGLGYLYIADTLNHTLRKIDLTTSEVSTVAGQPGTIGSADGRATEARFYYPSGIAVGSSGSVYVTDSGNNAIREVRIGGSVSTIAGLAGSTGAADGVGVDARFNNPGGLTRDGAGSTLYVVDTDNHTLRKVNIITGAVSTIAGSAGAFGSADGLGGTARFDFPAAIAWWNNGTTIGIADTANHTVRLGAPASPVTILTQPQSQAQREGTNVSFTVVASGQPSPTYQWYLNGEAIPGATGNTYSITSLERFRHVGAYTVVVSNAFGNVTSDTATLTVTDGASLGTGGAAPSGWFYLALAAVAAARAWTMRKGSKSARS
ncbi:MAG TPA: immunoglobulin domain-containing protein, partial [Opitutus sp.]|nr:immunoglobulin domain-containing protein [Opitutus sp.]